MAAAAEHSPCAGESGFAPETYAEAPTPREVPGRQWRPVRWRGRSTSRRSRSHRGGIGVLAIASAAIVVLLGAVTFGRSGEGVGDTEHGRRIAFVAAPARPRHLRALLARGGGAASAEEAASLRGLRRAVATRAASDESGDPFGRAGNAGPGAAGEQPELAALLQQLLGSELGPAAAAAGGGDAGRAATAQDPLAALLQGLSSGMQQPRPPPSTSDGFFVQRLPLLERVKRPILAAFFLYCLWKGWLGRWGCVLALATGRSYFDILAVPLRVMPGSPLVGKAYFTTQFYVDSGFKLLGYLINLVRGKATFPPKLPSLLSPLMFGAAPNFKAAEAPRRTATAPSSSSSARAPPKPPRSGEPPEVVDADVRFLD
eukprot:TRINITY_DN37503_c0_g1_i1.p1 TRINITY_DN37503_c0_g1~~TRINITY_DN37503_c0_g1_i1.p1  ORF type:complete len:421 (+),score=79.36 TRINITY_DN37503_c0_g1_i1:150-1265(+)